ncbi:MAG: alcohol dehydrogenase family protein [Acidimicrobiia bacterium]
MSIPATMRAVVLTGHGGPEVLEFRDDVPVPEPGPGEVLVEVSACGMNNTDINTRVGWYGGGSWGGGLEFPRIQGADPVGRIVAVGHGVAEEMVGRRVLIDGWLRGERLEEARYLGSEVDGGFAEYVAVPVTNAHPIETPLSDVELASFPCSYATAEYMLHRAGVREDHWVLVTGASGGVGGALIQLARRRGARVIALTSQAKIDAIEGAEVVLDREASDLAASIRSVSDGGVDVFADVVGGDLFATLLETVRRGGHYTAAGAIAGPIVSLDLRVLYLHDLTMHGATVLPPEVFSNLVGYIERGDIRPIVAATYPLKRIHEAQEAFVAKKHVGAIVIEIAGG